MKRQVKDLVANLKIKRPKLVTFFRRTQQVFSHDRENRPGRSDRRSNDADHQVDQLEACGYEVVSDVLETYGGTWESLSKVQA